MKTFQSSCLSLFLVAGFGAGAHAQTPPADINPALLYYQAFLVAPEPMAEVEMDYLASKDGRSQKLPERFDKIFAAYDNEFKLVRQAARATVPCDWGLDVGEGPATLLPYLARAKAVAIAAGQRVPWHLQHGRQVEACDELLAAVVLGRNVSRDGTYVSVLVDQAVECLVCFPIAEHFGKFSPETLQRFLAGLDATPAGATVAGCIATDKAFFQDWLLRKIQELQQASPGDDAKTMAGIHDLFAGLLDPQQDLPRMSLNTDSGQTNWWEQLTRAAGGTSEGVLALVRDLDAVHQKIAPILASPYGDFQRQLEQFQAEVQQSSNPLIPLVLPAWERGRPRELRTQTYLALVRAAVEYKLHGPSGLLRVTDPCAQGPFSFRRFVFQGVDRGFELKSAYDLHKNNAVLIFMEKEGPPFRVGGLKVGEPIR